MPNNPKIIRTRNAFIKRIFDIVLAALLLLIVLPTLIFIALAVKLESEGPVWFRQMRIGQNGIPIMYLKFRTMYVRSGKYATEPISSLSSEMRITKFGRFLKKTGMDELPALMNVLTGDMSFVGPRAALPLEADHYSETQRRRLDLKPGITGYWQVFGRQAGVNDIQRMVEMDLEYAQKQSLALDIKIMYHTLLLAVRQRAAY